MLSVRTVSLAFAGLVAIFGMGCGDGDGDGDGAGGSGGSGGSGAAGASGGAGGSGGSGGDTGGGGDGGGGSGGGMKLTSPDIAEGGELPLEYTCDGKDISPQLDWTPGPPETKSYALLFRDETNSLLHWAIWDIPASAAGLPVNVENTKGPTNVPGAKQLLSLDGSTYGYLGPCPPAPHTYRFTVFALKDATLPFIGPGDPPAADVQEEIEADKIAEASLSATYSPP